jgi:hypothetical protein
MGRRVQTFSLFWSLCLCSAGFGSAAWAQVPSVASASAVAAAAPVARVAVAVGEAQKVGPGGQAQALQVGASLSPGDRVRTGPDAVAILVFADEGRISLRADSELLIRHYEVDPAGVRTRIELELIKGTVRQISGNGSRSQPERYRLNTPIAVIGVRGTDFIAKAGADTVEAFVHEGRIVLLPRNERCADATSSGCDPLVMATSASNLRYVRLSAAGQVEQREFRPGELEKVFGIEIARTRQPGGSASTLARAPASGEFQLPLGTQFITDTIFVARLGEAAARASGSGTSGTSGTSGDVAQAPVSPATPAISTTPTATTPAVAGGDSSTPSTPVTPSTPSTPTVVAGGDTTATPALVPLPTNLVWGRFSNATALSSKLLQPFAEASAGRHVTVGELGEYALWRNGPTGRLDASLKGTASFGLAAAEAWLFQPGGASAAQVRDATLSVDFDRSTFAATVALNHAATGNAELAVNGKVNNEGVFVGTTATDRVAGALTRDGKEAGYLFSKDVSAGTFRGVTLWGRK